MFAYCLNNPTNNSDPSGGLALVDDIFVALLATVVILPVILIAVPPIPVLEAITTELSHFINEVTEIISYGANVLFAKTKGKERVRDTGLANESDEEIRKKAHDKSLPKSEQRRYQTEEKARGFRNRSKRMELYK